MNMAATSTTAPSTPESKSKSGPSRSFTLPSNFSSLANTASPTQAEITAAQGIETLFVHPSCTIVKFSTSSFLSSPSSGSKTRGLKWSSPTERTVAAGSLEIYRVPGSVSFLHSGELLHAIMPRSQCWCLDGVGKFALKVLPETYYRIELPASTTDDLEAIENFKGVLSKVMHYERTACPFARDSDEEELPELEDSRNKTFSRSDKAKQWKLDRTFSWKGDSGTVVQLRPVGSARPKRNISAQGTIAETARTFSGAGVAEIEEPRSSVLHDSGTYEPKSVAVVDEPLLEEDPIESLSGEEADPENIPAPHEAAFQLSSEPATEEPGAEDMSHVDDQAAIEEPQAEHVVSPESHQTVEGTSPQSESDSHIESAQLGATTPQAQDSVASGDGLVNFRPLQQIPTDMPPSPPDSSAGLSAPEELKITHLPAKIEEALAEPDVPGIATSIESTSSESNTEIRRRPSQASSQDDPFAAIQARILARRSIGGTTSFYPSVSRESTSCSTASVSSSISSRSRMPIGQQRNLASALVHKACTVFLGPPAYLVAMMLRIAARFANGKLRGVYSADTDEDDAVPGTYHVRNNNKSPEDSEEDDDDFGVNTNSPIRIAAARSLRERKPTTRSEVD